MVERGAAQMNNDSKAIEVLLIELKRKGQIVSRFYYGLGSADVEDWPRDAEVQLIEKLMEEKARGALQRSTMEKSLWRRCHDFAKEHQKWKSPSADLHPRTNDELQHQYKQGEGDYFEGVSSGSITHLIF
jgi:hypothetical protein